MRNKVLDGALWSVTLALCVATQQAACYGGRDWSLNGRLKQGSSVLYDLPEDGARVGPTNTTAEMKLAWRPNRQLAFIADMWWRGDFAPSLDSYDSGLGLQDPTSPGFNGRLPFRLNTGRCAGTLADPFCAASNEVRRFDDFDNEMLREFSLKYSDAKNRFTVKAGKFQRGWGQSDGLRLLDVLHAQDLRERFAFRDSDELRIPAWMVSADFEFSRMGIAGPFEALGMRRPTLEFNFVPEVHHSQFVINNPTPSDTASGAIFGLPFPQLRDPVSGLGLVGIGANLRDITPKSVSFDDAEYSLRLKFESLGGEFTLNAFYGQQDLPLVKFTGATLVAGNPLNSETAAVAAGGAAIPLDLATAIGAIHAPPGGYLTWLRSLAAGAPIAFPLSAGGLAPLSALSAGALPDCIDPVFGGGGLPCSVNANFDLDYDHRQTLVGFSFGRDMSEFKFGPKQTSPTLRIEMAFEFDKPYNRSIAKDPFIPGATVSGSDVLVIDPRDAITDSDVVSSMIGFDYPFWVPGWERQQKSIFTSFQFFNIHTFEADEGLLQQAPYAFDTVSEDHQYITFLWNMPIVNERLIFEGLFIRDFDNEGTFYRQRVDFQFFGNNWRPRIEWMFFDGEGENAPIGVLDRSDFVEFSLTYQF